MYKLKTSAAFDSAHFLAGYNGKCANIHGHRWTVEVVVAGSELVPDGEKRGMIIDFGDLKKAVRSLADSFDHALIYEEGFRLIAVPFRPTAESFARHFYEVLKAEGLPVSSVTVYETPENCAIYEEEN